MIMEQESLSLSPYLDQLDQVELLPWCGEVTATVGLLIESVGPAVAIGDFCEIDGGEDGASAPR